MSLFQQAPDPKSALGYHRILSPSAGIRVSPLCLGAMNFGDAWESFMGACDKKTTFEILDYFYEQGGNFIDTANNYQNEESETWLGDWMEERGNRNEMVIATKFTTGFRGAHASKEKLQSNFQGNHAKSLHISLNASLKKLKTDYVDILYLHWWDFSTGIEEVMQSLNTMVNQGKILYLGVSDTPAWIVSKANQYARDHGLRQFVVYQGKWNAAERDFERDILPMVEAEGMALAPWSALGGGKFKSEEQRKAQEGRQMGPASEKDVAISNKLEEIATKKGTLITSVALAYVMHKAPNVFPIVGGRKVEHLKGNIEALKLKLTDEEIEEIESTVPFDHGFPLNFLFMTSKKPTFKTEDVVLVKSNARLETLPRPQAIPPRP
ncbi:Versiconal hemiacetal acetate reductase [Sphaceloma murrayae]|uniref:Versiconal hemiacetal acetate reductase n=1 Tax=Sphaceloma murrayae TaxID=2082308 RepID=A0A2K1QUY6_9PEZI|nr:Versiconal hemiacetal acetate reductase [Sphaceloma murrayae]